jgi:large exoprotein involved in heme utilization and adhesion
VVDIRDGAGIAVNSLGSGTGGNITLTAGDLTLGNNAFISALTRSSGGGNIDLLIGNNLILQNNSFISTEAGTAQAGGNGGNINLNAFFTIGRNNSDIIANAFEGNGGSININTNGLFGFTVKNVDNPFTDRRNNITASSRFGSSGTTNINNAVDPSQGLGTLPGNLVDPSSLIDRRCDLARTPNASRFIILGKGGLPATARDLLSFAPLFTDLDLANPISLDSSIPTSTQTFAPTTDELRSTLNPGEPLHISRAIGLTQFLSNRCSN